jgi:hypothetical protein
VYAGTGLAKKFALQAAVRLFCAFYRFAAGGLPLALRAKYIKEHIMQVDKKTGKINPGKYAQTNAVVRTQVDSLDVNNKRQPKPVKTKTIQLKKAR